MLYFVVLFYFCCVFIPKTYKCLIFTRGVILYGMVVGQLPFVTSRTEHVPSPERRKRLLAQINKGLATSHRKALANMSPDFRTMMTKLLIIDSSKRITIKELLLHSWMTEKGMKEIRINPVKRLDDHHHRRVSLLGYIYFFYQSCDIRIDIP